MRFQLTTGPHCVSSCLTSVSGDRSLMLPTKTVVRCRSIGSFNSRLISGTTRDLSAASNAFNSLCAVHNDGG